MKYNNIFTTQDKICAVTVYFVAVIINVLLARLDYCFVRGMRDEEEEVSKYRAGRTPCYKVVDCKRWPQISHRPSSAPWQRDAAVPSIRR